MKKTITLDGFEPNEFEKLRHYMETVFDMSEVTFNGAPLQREPAGTLFAMGPWVYKLLKYNNDDDNTVEVELVARIDCQDEQQFKDAYPDMFGTKQNVQKDVLEKFLPDPKPVTPPAHAANKPKKPTGPASAQEYAPIAKPMAPLVGNTPLEDDAEANIELE